MKKLVFVLLVCVALLVVTGCDLSRDPKFASCTEAITAGYGPYEQNKDTEYNWYQDTDGDGIVCE